jgi:MoxR-like ATPase
MKKIMNSTKRKCKNIEKVNMNKKSKIVKTADNFKKDLFHELTGGILDRIRNLQVEMKRHFWGKEYDEIINNIIIAAMSGQPILLIGKPGFAKSLLMTTFFNLIGLSKSASDTLGKNKNSTQDKFFHYLLHSFTMPDEILGVVKIGEFLEENRFVRQREGALTDPAVKATFLDEIFNANSTILNTLLSIINEREFYEGGIAHQSNLFIVAGAANRVPSEPELNAFFDRFPMRILVGMDLNETISVEEYREKVNSNPKESDDDDEIITIDIDENEFDDDDDLDDEIDDIDFDDEDDEDDELDDIEEENNISNTLKNDPVFFKVIEQGLENMKHNAYNSHGIISDRYIHGKNVMPSINDFKKVYEFIITHYSPANLETFGKNSKETFNNLVKYLPLSGTCSLNGRKIVKLYLLSAASALLRTAFDGSGDEAFELPAIEVSDLAVFKNIWNNDNEETVEEHHAAVNNFLNEF